MSTIQYFPLEDIREDSNMFSSIRSTIETAFHANNVTKVTELKAAYQLAKNSPGTIVTDVDVFDAEKLGLEPGSKVLISNDGAVTGRASAARRISGIGNARDEEYGPMIREAVYAVRKKQLLHTEVYIGLDPRFMVKAHLLMPEGEENLLYSWMLNFQHLSPEYQQMYNKSTHIPGETDIYIFADPSWSHPDYPMGLVYFDPLHNCAAILGMRYFGELKKGTLTLAWGIAERNGFVSCHGGLKRYALPDSSTFVAAVFGLSGSGKSTITHAVHDDKYDITVLHDDAFIINTEDGSSIALEPSYFDKTQDYSSGSQDNKFLVTAQNIGATVDKDGHIVPVTEDIRNSNGRAIKSKLWSPNRVDIITEPINAIFWLMKDPTLPPIIKITNAKLASTMGATLSTRRTSAERLKLGADLDSIVIEPFANPFRIYPLEHDFQKFKMLFSEKNVDCYILNTGDFMRKKITPDITLGCIEAVVEKKANFVKMGPFPDLEIMEIEGFIPDFHNMEYMFQLEARLEARIEFLYLNNSDKSGFNFVPVDAINALEKLLKR